jgi:hypothetical protein
LWLDAQSREQREHDLLELVQAAILDEVLLDTLGDFTALLVE